ncbi:MAG: hypothetical protein WAW07_05430 [Bacteroidales bacterium]
MNNAPVVILGLQETGLYTAQALGKYNIPVYGFDSVTDRPGFYSRYLKPFLAPHPYKEPDTLFREMIKLSDKLHARAVLISTTEDYLQFQVKYREALEEYYKFIIPEPDFAGKILDKSGQATLALNCGFKIPGHSEIKGIGDFNQWLKNHTWTSIIIKASDQAVWKTRVTQKAFIPSDIDELEKTALLLLNMEVPFIIQDMLDGDCLNNFEFNALMINGEIVESSVTQKLRQYPPGFGAACLIRSTANEEVSLMGRMFVAKNKIEGFSNTEFKYNPVDKKFYFIETNARVWSQVRMTEYNGQNFIIKYYNYLTDNSILFNTTKYDKEIKWVDIFSDFVLWWRFLRKDRMNLFKWLLSLADTKDFGLLNIRDVKPFLHELSRIKLFRSNKRKV